MSSSSSQKVKEKILDEKCENCGTRLKQVPNSKGHGGIVTCPNFYRDGKFEDCDEVVCEIPENKQANRMF